ncbi:MAG: UPF0280 family protein [Proteobacteria bacterium]|nr:UPF0280 family protein [Pseudomonadota bacterium]
MKRIKVRKPESYVERTYRTLPEHGLVSSFAKIKDTDLHILADLEVSAWAFELALQYRLQIEKYIELRPEFLSALSPLAPDALAPPIVKEMLAAGQVADVGPMAAVAGVIAEYVGKALLQRGCREVMVENGGDIYISRTSDCTVAVFAGQSTLSLKVGIKLTAAMMPVAVCTSSGTVGHSLSFGLADAVVVLAGSTALADAAATRLGNEVGTSTSGVEGIKRALRVGPTIEGVQGVVVICGEKIGAVGKIELVKLT